MFGSGFRALTEAASEITAPFAIEALIFAMTVIVADAPLERLAPLAVTFPEELVQLHPLGAEQETNVVPRGRLSDTATSSAVAGPLLVTISVNVAFNPATTGFGVTLSVIDRSVGFDTVVVAVAVLLPLLGSGAAELTEAELVMVVPSAVAALTLATSVTVTEAPFASVPMLTVTVFPLTEQLPAVELQET